MVERVIFPFRGAELGGSHVATFTLASAIQRRSQTECVVLCAEDTLIMAEARKLGFRTVASGEAPTGRNSAVTDVARIGQRRRLLEGLKSNRGAVVHTNDVNSLRAWGLPARLSSMGVVYHHHALNRMWWPPHLVSLAYANAIVCVSDSTMAAMQGWRKDAIKELNPFEIDRSVDRTSARRALLDEFGWPDDAQIVGWIGNFWERKRPGFFIDAAAALARLNSRARFVMFGRDGDHTRSAVQQMASERGMSNVTAVPGFRQPVEANIAALDLLLAPAPREPFGRALVEAIILGTPIVATRGAGHSEIIGAWGGGRLADENATPAQVAQLCSEVLAAPDAHRLSPAAATKVATQLSPDAYADRFLALYDRTVTRRNARAPAEPATPAPESSPLA